jgi:Flp pilus assembly protein TadD
MGSPEALSLRKELVYSLASHGEWAAAVHPLLELSVQRPNDAEVRTLLATAYREQGLFEQAAASYQEAIRLDPRNAKAYGGRGILREISGDSTDAALDDFRAAIRLNPREAAYSNNLGFALCVRGRYKEAAAALQEGLRYDPLSRRMRNNLGFIYGKLGQYDRARREFQHAGTEDEVENNVGYVYEQGGDMTEACAHYRRALADNPLLRAAADNAQRACVKGAPSEGRTP